MSWTEKYKRSIDCDNPKGFSQRAHCQGRKKNVHEDVPANSAGGGNVAGIGVGPQGEPGINKKKKLITFKQFFKRKEIE